MEPVKSRLDARLETQAANDEAFEKAKVAIRKQLAFREAFRNGTLTLAQFKTLNARMKKLYTIHHGRPLSSAEKKADDRKKTQRTKRNKQARKSRATNRKKGR
jgi:hypothetical protein